MRIAYLLTSDIVNYMGSTKKIRNQVESWRLLGHEVEVFARVPIRGESVLEARQYLKTGNPIMDVFKSDEDILEDLRVFNPDCLYMRQSFPYRTYIRAASLFPTIVEINTDDLKEYRSLMRLSSGLREFVKFILVMITRGRLYRRIRGFSFITKELAESRRFRCYRKPYDVFPNSIAFGSENNDIIKIPEERSNGCRFFFIGSPGFDWHGTDKIEAMIGMLGKGYSVDIVGLEGDTTDSVRYHGYMTEKEYKDILRSCHICLGTFALHRKNLNECSTIKFTEYLKYGFPVILPYKETALLYKKIPSWIMILPNIETVFFDDRHIRAIRDFCNENRNYIVTHDDALDLVGSEKIEKNRIAFMANAVGAR